MSARPDMVLVGDDDIILVEITIPCNFPDNLTKRLQVPKESYRKVISDLEARDFSVLPLTYH